MFHESIHTKVYQVMLAWYVLRSSQMLHVNERVSFRSDMTWPISVVDSPCVAGRQNAVEGGGGGRDVVRDRRLPCCDRSHHHIITWPVEEITHSCWHTRVHYWRGTCHTPRVNSESDGDQPLMIKTGKMHPHLLLYHYHLCCALQSNACRSLPLVSVAPMSDKSDCSD